MSPLSLGRFSGVRGLAFWPVVFSLVYLPGYIC